MIVSNRLHMLPSSQFYLCFMSLCLGFSTIFNTFNWSAFNIMILTYLFHCKLIFFFVASSFLGLVSLGFHVPIGLFYCSCLVFPIKIECLSLFFRVGSFPWVLGLLCVFYMTWTSFSIIIATCCGFFERLLFLYV
jgi:hypothetical protein